MPSGFPPAQFPLDRCTNQLEPLPVRANNLVREPAVSACSPFFFGQHRCVVIGASHLLYREEPIRLHPAEKGQDGPVVTGPLLEALLEDLEAAGAAGCARGYASSATPREREGPVVKDLHPQKKRSSTYCRDKDLRSQRRPTAVRLSLWTARACAHSVVGRTRYDSHLPNWNYLEG